MSHLPKTQRAFAVIEKDSADVVANKSLPTLEPDTIIVNVKAIALNPVDWKHVAWRLEPGSSVGADFCGDIVAIGSAAESSGLKVGDAVAGCIHGGLPDPANGAFQEYVRAYPELVWRKPPSLPYEVAAAMGGIALSTAVHALYHTFKLPYPGQAPGSSNAPLLVWAGSTGVGMYAIRLAKLSGLKVVTTASPHNHELLKKLGADAVFDYRDPEVSRKIREWSGGSIDFALDCISEHGSTKLVAAAFGEKGGKIVTLLPVEKDDAWPPSVLEQDIHLYDILEKGTQAFKDMAEWNKLLPILIDEGKLGEDSVPLKRWDGGLSGVREALRYLRDGNVSAEKIILKL